MNIEAQAWTNPEGNIDRASLERNTETADFIERVRVNQQKLAAEIKPHYDFIGLRIGFFWLGCGAQAGRESGRRCAAA
jgi:hypothetical protein